MLHKDNFAVKRESQFFRLVPQGISLKLAALAILLFGCLKSVEAAAGIGSSTGLPLPRFAALKASEINLRAGPGLQYPIKAIYKCSGYPALIFAEFGLWRLVQDSDGSEGWVHQSLITGKRSAIITNNKFTKKAFDELSDKESLLFTSPDEGSRPVTRLEFGVVVQVKKCSLAWCYVRAEDKFEGWISKENIWGVFPEEVIGG